jgi:glucokinase
MADKSALGIVADIGGTHARFALAGLTPGGTLELTHCHTFPTADFPSLEEAVSAYRGKVAVPPRAAFAVAAPLSADEVKLTNSAWRFRQSELKQSLDLEQLVLINDFAAIGHALPYCSAQDFQSLNGAGAFALPQSGAISIVGPGTGLGVGLLLRQPGADSVVPSEGGHIGFAPPDPDAFRMLEALWQVHGRVSAERLLCGDGLIHFHEALGGKPAKAVALWQAAIKGEDPIATAAMERWLYILGMYAGDIALVHGAAGVVMAGGILPRLGPSLRADIFMAAFCDKGRFSQGMARLPVAMLCNGQPGLLGAAAVLKAEG